MHMHRLCVKVGSRDDDRSIILKKVDFIELLPKQKATFSW